MNLLEYFVLPLISLIVLFLLTKLMGYRQVTELSLYDYIIGITIGSIAAEMVREVNKNEVERQEVLSDRVYSYDKEKHQIRQEPDSIQKVKEMER